MEIIVDTLSEAHEAAVDAILNTSKAIEIQTHADKAEKTIEFEAEDGSDEIITIKVLHPLQEPQVSLGTKFQKGLIIGAYKKQFLTITPPRADGNHATYTYWNRLADFPIPTYGGGKDGQYFEGDGKGNGFNQVSELVKKLAADPNSRRGVMITWNPLSDATSLEPPCMNWVQFVIRKGKIHMRVIFRSQDIMSGLGENLVGCAALLEFVTEEINTLRREGKFYEVGSLILVSFIPHIYNFRDSDELGLMKKEINRKKTFKIWKPIIVRQ